MARKRPAPETIEPSTAPKRGRASMAQKTPAARSRSTARKRTVAQKKPRQTVQVPVEGEVAEGQGAVSKGQGKAASTNQKDTVAPKDQKTTTATRQTKSAADKNQKATASTKSKRTAAPKKQTATASTRQKTRAPKSQNTTASTRRKRAAGLGEEQESSPTKKQKQCVPAAAEHAPSEEVQVPFVTPPPEAKGVPSKPCVYSFEFFEDMTKTIASNFPFAEFAARHSCKIHEVARVISATIVGPLSDPSFDWYDNEILTIPGYVTVMTEAWEQHYQKSLVANVQPVESGKGTDWTADSDWSDDGSSSDSDSDASSAGSSADSSDSSSSYSNRSLPNLGESVGNQESGSRIETSSAAYKNEGNDPATHCADNSGDETEDEVNEEVRARVAEALREPHLKQSKYVPVERPRVHVYKDEWGRYVPVPTKEEQEEQERRQWSERDARRIR